MCCAFLHLLYARELWKIGNRRVFAKEYMGKALMYEGAFFLLVHLSLELICSYFSGYCSREIFSYLAMWDWWLCLLNIEHIQNNMLLLFLDHLRVEHNECKPGWVTYRNLDKDMLESKWSPFVATAWMDIFLLLPSNCFKVFYCWEYLQAEARRRLQLLHTYERKSNVIPWNAKGSIQKGSSGDFIYHSLLWFLLLHWKTT